MLFDHATARTLGMARIWVFGLAAVSRLFFPLWEVCYMTDYTAVGVMRLLGADAWVPLITPSVAIAIEALTVGLLLAVAAGIRPYRLLAPLACVAFTISEGMMRGEGVIPHAHLGLLLTTYVLACFPAANDAATLSRKQSCRTTDPVIYQSALVVASLVFYFTYTLAAARRLSLGGLEIFLDNSILVATATRDAEIGEAGGLGIQACESVVMSWTLLLGFPIVTLLELLSPLCLFSKRFRWIWIAVLAPFHVGTGLLMGIWFNYNLALIPLLAGGFDPFRRRYQRKQGRDSS